MESKTGIKIHKGLSIQFYFPSVIVCGFAGFVVNKGYSHSGIFFAFAKINARVEFLPCYIKYPAVLYITAHIKWAVIYKAVGEWINKLLFNEIEKLI